MTITSTTLKKLPRSPLVRSPLIANIAPVYPELAASMATGLLTPGGYGDTGGWEIVTLAARWDQPGANQVVDAQQFSSDKGGAQAPVLIGPEAPGSPRGKGKGGGGVLEANLWVRAMTYTVQRPNAFTQQGAATRIFKAQSDWTNSQNPGIDVSLELVTPFCKAEVSVAFTPIENMRVSFDTSFPAGFFSRSDAQINCQMTNKRVFVEDDNELPVVAVIALHCWRLPYGAVDRYNREAARALLKELGYA